MTKALTTFVTAVVLLMTGAAAADAQYRRLHHWRRGSDGTVICNKLGCSYSKAHAELLRVLDANGNGVVVGRRPFGCPHEFCGCEASLYLFGKIRRELNLASNWLKKFPHTLAAPGMAAVRNHHVMVLVSHVAGNIWMVHDGNSGGGLTRDHALSIDGYIIVNPRS